MDIFDLSRKVAIVTGGNGGLGLGLARGLANAGANVSIVGRNEEKLKSAVEDLQAIGPRILPIVADMAKAEDIKRMVDETVNSLGRVDILVNNAAVSYGVSASKMTMEQWSELISINLTGPFLAAQAVYPEMLKVGGGKIINIGTALVHGSGHAKLVHYASAKGGLKSMTESLAVAWGPDNINVNSLLPGLVDSEMMPCTGPNKARGAVDYVVRKTPMQCYGVPDDFQGIIMFLASNASKFMTGATLVMDGGYGLAP